MRFQSAATLLIILLSSPTIFAQASSATKDLVRPANKRQQVIDFAISDNGEFRGVVADRSGKPQADFDVMLLNRTEVIGVARTDATGRFAFANVAPGRQVLRTTEAAQNIRLWPAKLAPPNAKSGVLLVAGDSTVRAQGCSGGANCGGCDSCGGTGIHGHFGGVFQRILQNPWLIGAGTAAAIAIPLATDDDDQRDGDFTSQLEISDDVDTDGDGAAGEPAS